jgi:bacterioferritin (cytochrome b1)
MAYRSFADRVKGPWRDALVAHWSEHAEEERQAAYDVAMKIVGLGADPMVTTVTVPQSTANVEGFCQVLAGMELEAIAKARSLVELSGGNTSMKVLAENLVLVDTQHLDDLRRMASAAA